MGRVGEGGRVMVREPKAGDWVTVTAMVVDPSPHPNDYTVRLESHNEHYEALVRRARCQPASAPVDWPRCSSLVAEGDALYQCALLLEHADSHENGGTVWTTAEEYGRVE